MSVELRPLVGPAAPELGEMTFPAYRHFLALEPRPRHPELGETTPVRPFGVVAVSVSVDGERPVGLALAEEPLDAEAPAAQLLSVFVRPTSRRAGVAGALVETIEAEARRRGRSALETTYTTGKPGIASMERLFARRGWEPPQPASVLAHFTPQAALGSPFWAGLPRYRLGLEIFPWQELGDDEAAEIRRSNAERCWVEPALEPWHYPKATLDASSVGARHEGRVVGWVLNHRVLPGVVRFSVSYMHPDLSRRAKVAALYHASLSYLVEQGTCRQCTFITPYSYGPMVVFAERAIAPFASFFGESRRCRIALRP